MGCASLWTIFYANPSGHPALEAKAKGKIKKDGQTERQKALECQVEGHEDC
jgi:hypothetical protein